MELNKNFEKIYISVESQDAPVTKRLQNHFFPEQIEWVQQQPLAEKNGMLSATEFDRSKRQIYIHPFKGRFFKRCPGAGPGLTCCNYFVLNLGQQCDMNCSYCYLQSFINSPIMSIYSNLDQALSELKDRKSTRLNLILFIPITKILLFVSALER